MMKCGWVVVVAVVGCSSADPSVDAARPFLDANTDVRTPCTPGCSSVQTCCEMAAGNRCVDVYSDPDNCGGCGIECAAGELCINLICATP